MNAKKIAEMIKISEHMLSRWTLGFSIIAIRKRGR